MKIEEGKKVYEFFWLRRLRIRRKKKSEIKRRNVEWSRYIFWSS